MKAIEILGVKVNDTTKEEALEFIVKGLQKGSKKMSIFTPNPEIIVQACTDEGFKGVVNTADLALVDGVGLILAGKLLGKQFQERITGVDFMLGLCELAAKEGFTVGLMGGRPKIAERTAECLLRKYPNLKICYLGQEWDPEGFLESKEDVGLKIKDLRIKNQKSSIRNHQSIDILFVALGFPKQERWIYENLPKIPVRVAMTVGGSFDYISGAIPRAPLFIRMLGFEWFFRLIVQPWRFKRQLALARFLFLILKERFSTRSS